MVPKREGGWMKKVILSFYCLMLSTSAFAGTSDIVASNNLFGVQYRSTNVNYTEVGNGIFGTQTGVLDTETGPVGGFGLTLSSMTGPGHAYVHGEFDLATGSTTYTGAFQGGVWFGSRDVQRNPHRLQFTFRSRIRSARAVHADPLS